MKFNNKDLVGEGESLSQQSGVQPSSSEGHPKDCVPLDYDLTLDNQMTDLVGLGEMVDMTAKLKEKK